MWVWDTADFKHARIDAERADFERTEFRDFHNFDYAQFSGSVDFSFCAFKSKGNLELWAGGLLRISGANFDDGYSVAFADCGEFQAEFTIVEGEALMDGLEVRGDATFSNAAFNGPVVLNGFRVHGTADFSDVVWSGHGNERYSTAVDEWLILDGSEFVLPAHWHVKAKVVSAVATIFRDSASFSLEGGSVAFDRAVFEGPARISGQVFDDAYRASSLIPEEVVEKAEAGPATQISNPIGGRSMSRFGDPEAREIPSLLDSQRPQLISLRRADVRRVSLTDIGASGCHFYDAVALDRLRWTNIAWGETPFGRVRRRVIAEEAALRAARGRTWGWRAASHIPNWIHDPSLRPLGAIGLEATESPDPIAIAETYRQLRKSREDAKDAPGASDFYYGEMEMRRIAAPIASGERLLLSLYWGIAGYGMRASRSILSLALVVMVGMYLMASCGYCEPTDPFGSTPIQCASKDFSPPLNQVLSIGNVSFVAGTAITIVGAPGAHLTDYGHAIRLGLRIVGPLLVALSLLALRNRVKR